MVPQRNIFWTSESMHKASLILFAYTATTTRKRDDTLIWHQLGKSENTRIITLEHHQADFKVVCNNFISEFYNVSTYVVILFLPHNRNVMPSRYSRFHFIGEEAYADRIQ